MKKIFLILFLAILLVGTVSAADWDNKLTYSNEDLKVEFDDTFLRLFKTAYIGSIELKSHSSVDEIIQVSVGESVVMYYDFNFEQEYLNGLGEIEFTDLKTGKIVERNWEYVYYTEVVKDVYEEVCNNITQSCEQVIKSQVKEMEWVPYNSKDILIGQKRIGIMVYTEMGDYVDVVWDIAGKKVKKHASYEANSLTSAHGLTLGSTGTQTGKMGARWQITFPNPEITLFNITNVSKVAGSTSTTAYVQTAWGSGILGTATFIGDIATFNPEVSVSKDTIYYILTDSGGSSRTEKHGGSPSYPIYDHNGTYISGVNQAGDTDAGYMMEIKNITFKYFVDTDNYPGVTLNSPVNTYNSTSNTITFNATASDDINLVNVSLYLDGVLNETNSSGFNDTYYTFTKTFHDGDYNWTIEAFDNATKSTTATTRTFSVDTTYPKVAIIHPNTTINYHVVNTNLTFNWSANDTNLDSCWYEYAGVNTSLTCVDNTTSFNITSSTNRTIDFYVNDTFGHLNKTSVTWAYNVFENSRTLNTTSYQTQSETFSINVTANSSLTAVTLDYNGTEYATTLSGTTYSKTFDIPLASLGNNSIKWKFTHAGSSIYSDYSYQNITNTVFTLCNTTYTTKFLNISFKDESDDSNINASIPTSNFVYYLGSGAITKTYTFINATVNDYYEFCATPNLTFYTDPYIQYKQGTDYPQRIYDAEVLEYTNTTTNLTLYLLGTADGIYVTFQVANSATQPISGVEVTATREISGSDVQVGIGTTGADGGVTLWLNPDFSHDFAFSKSGLTTYTTSFAPTQSAYTIIMGETETISDSHFKGIDYSILPENLSLTNDTDYTFGFNLTSSFWSLDEYGFDLRLVNGTIITGGSTTTSGTPLTLVYNTKNQSKIYLDYYWEINSTYTNGTIEWRVYSTEYTQWSIFTFKKDLILYLDSGFFGIDDFGRNLLIFILIFFIAGIVSYKFGFTSPIAVATTIFLTCFFLETIIGIIPPYVLKSGKEITSMLTFLSGLVLVMMVWREIRK